MTLASSAIAAVPDEPYEIPYARALAKTIAVTGLVFSIVVFVTGCRCFYRRHVSRIDSIVCVVFSTVLAAMHFMNSLSHVGTLYVVLTIAFICLLLVDWGIVAIANSEGAEP